MRECIRWSWESEQKKKNRNAKSINQRMKYVRLSEKPWPLSMVPLPLLFSSKCGWLRGESVSPGRGDMHRMVRVRVVAKTARFESASSFLLSPFCLSEEPFFPLIRFSRDPDERDREPCWRSSRLVLRKAESVDFLPPWPDALGGDEGGGLCCESDIARFQCRRSWIFQWQNEKRWSLRLP